jgi:hypothetical protein
MPNLFNRVSALLVTKMGKIENPETALAAKLASSMLHNC